jgi:hypothetical protein
MCVEYLLVVDCLLGSETMSTAPYSPIESIIFCCSWYNNQWVIYKREDTLFRKIWELSFSVSLALSNYRPLKNISGVIPTHHDLDVILVIDCIRDFRRQSTWNHSNSATLQNTTEHYRTPHPRCPPNENPTNNQSEPQTRRDQPSSSGRTTEPEDTMLADEHPNLDTPSTPHSL